MTTAPTSINPEIREAWVQALRSGAYKQVFGIYAGADNERCAWGVLNQLYTDAHLADEYSYLTPGDYGHPNNRLVHEWSGVSLDFWVRVVDLNDRLRMSFDQIADIIEREA